MSELSLRSFCSARWFPGVHDKVEEHFSGPAGADKRTVQIFLVSR